MPGRISTLAGRAASVGLAGRVGAQGAQVLPARKALGGSAGIARAFAVESTLKAFYSKHKALR